MFDPDTPFNENYKSFKDLMTKKRGQKAVQDKLYYDFTEYAKKRAKFGKDPAAIEWVVIEDTIGKITDEKEDPSLTEWLNRNSKEAKEQELLENEELEDSSSCDQDQNEVNVSSFNLDDISFQSNDDECEDNKNVKNYGYDADLDSDYFKTTTEKLRKESKTGVIRDIDYPGLAKIKRHIEGFIGLDNVKQETEEIISFAEIQQLKRERNLSNSILSFNIAFTGDPGTGKTTMARQYGQLFKALGVLEKGHVVEVSRSDLIGAYIGHTEKMTQEVFYEALDGVLFIDEAHNIYNPSCPYDFGKECLATLIKLMEDFRERVVVIFSGYEKPLQNTLFRYEGMSSRVPHIINFESYSPEELVKIFIKISAEKDYIISDDCSDGLVSFLKTQSRKSNKEWNGREIRNLFEKSLIKQSRRLSAVTNPTDEQLLTIESIDLKLPVKLSSGNVINIDNLRDK